MIISKDLFILGDEYLTMPRQEKYAVCPSRRLESSSSAGCRLPQGPGSGGGVASTPTGPQAQARPVELSFRGLSVSCGSKAILQDVSGLVRPGEMLAVMGPSGESRTAFLTGTPSVDGFCDRARLFGREPINARHALYLSRLTGLLVGWSANHLGETNRAAFPRKTCFHRRKRPHAGNGTAGVFRTCI